MSVGHNAKTAAEAGLQPWLHGGGGGGEAACVRLSIRKSIIGPRAGLQKGRRMCATFWKLEPKAARRDAVTRGFRTGTRKMGTTIYFLPDSGYPVTLCRIGLPSRRGG